MLALSEEKFSVRTCVNNVAGYEKAWIVESKITNNANIPSHVIVAPQVKMISKDNTAKYYNKDGSHT